MKNEKFDMNLSEFWDELLNHIHLVDSHKADIMCKIHTIENDVGMASPEGGFSDDSTEKVYWIGYRAMGVDDYGYILNNVYDTQRNEIRDEGYWYYRRLFRLSFKVVGEELHAELQEVDIHDFVRAVRRGGF